MRDDLPNTIRQFECEIVNMDSSSGEGTHCTDYVKKEQKIIYLDSYGNLPPPPELIFYFQSDVSKSEVTYTYDTIQNFNSHRCGNY